MKSIVAYRASAGTGKTFALSIRYLVLLFSGAQPKDIVALTFTNKATSQMRERIAYHLANLLDDEKLADVLKAITEQTGMSKKEIEQRQPAVLEKFLNSTVHIATLDSFFSSILKSQSLELGIDPEYLSVPNRDKTRVKILFLEELYAKSLLPLLVKVSVEINDRDFGKIFEALDLFYKNENILPKQIKGQNNEIKSIVLHIKTLRENVVAKLQKVNASQSAIKNFLVEDVDEFLAKPFFEKSTLFEHGYYKKPLQIDSTIEDDYQEIKELIGNYLIAKQQRKLESFYTIYDYYKNAIIRVAKDDERLAFDDVAVFTNKLLSNENSRDFLYFKLDSRVKHILLDEFQDTSILQYHNLQPILDEINAGIGQHDFRSMFVVGDAKQSLYRWRGGEERVFDLLLERYDIEPLDMSVNYRSSKNVIAKTNEWFVGKMKDFIPQMSQEKSVDGYVHIVSTSQEQILEDTVMRIKKLQESGVELSDIAILVFTNDDGALLQQMCYEEKIETRLHTKNYLKNSAYIASLVAFVGHLFVNNQVDAFCFLKKYNLLSYDSSWFEPQMQPLEILDRLICDFGFSEDKNLLRLLDFAAKYSDISLFVQEFKASEVQRAEGDLSGAVIITIDSAKGLEFKHVIVMDKAKGPNNARDYFLFQKDTNLDIQKIYIQEGVLKNFSKEYSDALQQEESRREKDSLNKLYVALTRAEIGMSVVQKEKGSQFATLDIEPVDIGMIEGEKKDRQPIKTQPIFIQINRYGLQEQKKQTQDQGLSHEAIVFGEALHFALESLGDFIPHALKYAMQNVRLKYGRILGEAKLENIEQRVARLLNDESFCELIRDAKIYKESSFIFEGELKRVDLLLEYEWGMVVVDYKSSTKYQEKHKEQVANYQKALKGLTSKETFGKIIYLLEDTIEILSLN